MYSNNVAGSHIYIRMGKDILMLIIFPLQILIMTNSTRDVTMIYKSCCNIHSSQTTIFALKLLSIALDKKVNKKVGKDVLIIQQLRSDRNFGQETESMIWITQNIWKRDAQIMLR